MDEDKDLDYWDKKLKDVESTVLTENFKAVKECLYRVKKKCKKRTAVNYIMILLPFLNWAKKPFTAMDKYDIDDYLELQKCKSESTIEGMKIILRAFLRPINPEAASTIEPHNVSSNVTPDALLSDDDIRALIKAAPNPRDKALIACFYDSGCRRSELLSTTITDAKFDDYGCVLWLRESKTQSRPARLVFASSYLRDWLNVHPRKDEPTAPIFCSLRTPYNAISRSGLYEQLKVIKAKTGIKKPTNCHNYRHSRATDLAKKLTEQQMKKVLGWTPKSNMCSVYVHLSGEDVDEAMLKVAGIKRKDKPETTIKSSNCPRCDELNDDMRETCRKCGLILSEKKRFELEEAEREKRAAELEEMKKEITLGMEADKYEIERNVECLVDLLVREKIAAILKQSDNVLKDIPKEKVKEYENEGDVWKD
jgi:integrase/recombinase XerD